jgi:predicted RNA-binding protein YlxR (DUF448 family)
MTMATEMARNERTCTGCGKRDSLDALVRVVLGPEGAVAADVFHGAYGRGAHVHPRRECLERACRAGLARAFKSKVDADPRALARHVVEGVDRRVAGLLGGAKRGGHLAVGADAVREAIGGGDAKLVVVAADGAAGAESREVRAAIDAGRALVWGTKKTLGGALGRDEVAVCAVLADGVARAIGSAHAAARQLRSEAWWSEVR